MPRCAKLACYVGFRAGRGTVQTMLVYHTGWDTAIWACSFEVPMGVYAPPSHMVSLEPCYLPVDSFAFLFQKIRTFYLPVDSIAFLFHKIRTFYLPVDSTTFLFQKIRTAAQLRPRFRPCIPLDPKPQALNQLRMNNVPSRPHDSPTHVPRRSR